jgi:hypothetical protein
MLNFGSSIVIVPYSNNVVLAIILYISACAESARASRFGATDMPEDVRQYGEGRDPIPSIDEPTIVFIINRSLPSKSWTNEDVYRSTRCCWVIKNEEIRNQAVYALGVSHGVVRGAYRIERWHHEGGDRWSFDGHPVTELDVVDRSFARLKGRQGDARAVRPFLNGISAPSQTDQ